MGPSGRGFEPLHSDQILRFRPHKRRKASRFAAFTVIYSFLGVNNMFEEKFNLFYMRPFWNEMNVPQSLAFKIYKEYLGTENMKITLREESIKYISPIVNRLQREILDWIKSTNTNQVIKDLYQVFDKCFGLYVAEKKTRKKFVELNISDDSILNAFNCNRNMALDVLNSVNLWIENAVLYQNEANPAQINKDSTVDSALLL